MLVLANAYVKQQTISAASLTATRCSGSAPTNRSAVGSQGWAEHTHTHTKDTQRTQQHRNIVLAPVTRSEQQYQTAKPSATQSQPATPAHSEQSATYYSKESLCDSGLQCARDRKNFFCGALTTCELSIAGAVVVVAAELMAASVSVFVLLLSACASKWLMETCVPNPVVSTVVPSKHIKEGRGKNGDNEFLNFPFSSGKTWTTNWCMELLDLWHWIQELTCLLHRNGRDVAQ